MDEEAEAKELKKKLKEEYAALQLLAKRITQAYRIKLQCMLNRHELLKAISNRFADIGSFEGTSKKSRKKGGKWTVTETLRGEEAFYAKLKNNLDRERRILGIIQREDTEAGSNIAYAIEKMEEYHKQAGKYDQIEAGFMKYGLSRKDLERFLLNMVTFLRNVNDDLSDVEKRIEVEEKFLKERDAEHFRAFIKSWRDEIRANRRLLRDFERTMRRNRRMYERLRSELSGKLGAAGGATTVLGVIGAFVAHPVPTRDPQLMHQSLLMMIIGFSVMCFSGILYQCWVEVKKTAAVIHEDKALLERLAKIREAKKKL